MFVFICVCVLCVCVCLCAGAYVGGGEGVLGMFYVNLSAECNFLFWGEAIKTIENWLLDLWVHSNF